MAWTVDPSCHGHCRGLFEILIADKEVLGAERSKRSFAVGFVVAVIEFVGAAQQRTWRRGMDECTGTVDL
jgi:hypothetical protein